MEKEFAALPAPARRLLGSSTGALVLGPLWLLWHGAWRTALRCYLPLVLADACSRGLVGFGMAHHTGLWVQLGSWGMVLCLAAGFACNVYGSFRWPQLALPRARHWVAPLVGLAGVGLLLFAAMELGGRI